MFNNENTALAYLSAPSAQIATAPTFTANRKGLLAALATVCGVIEKRNTIPILSNVLLTTGNGGPLQLVGTDLDIETRLNMETSNAWGDFSATLPAHQLRDVLKKATGETVTLTMEQEHVTEWTDDKDADGKPIKRPETSLGRVKLRFDNGASMTLQSLPPADFPEIPLQQIDSTRTMQTLHTFQIEAADLADTLSRAAFAISTEETRYYLNGIYMHFTASDVHGVSGLCFTATDGHRLAHRSIAGLVPTNIPGVIVPRKTVNQMIKALGKKATGKIKISLTSSRVRFAWGETVFTSKLIDGTFPDYQRVIPRQNMNRVTLDRAALAAMVEQVQQISLEKSRAVKLEFEAGRIIATVNNPESGTATASMACAMESDFSLTIGFNGRYLTDVCEAMRGDTLDLELNDYGSPTVFKSTADARGLAVLMPMRV